MREVRVLVRTVDHHSETRRFKTLAGARRFAHKWVGEAPDLGLWYAVSFDGMVTVTVYGATLAEVFPKSAAGEE